MCNFFFKIVLFKNNFFFKIMLFKNSFYECVVCVCLTFGTIFVLIAFLMAIRFLIGVMTISFALPIDLYKSLRISKNGQLIKFYF